MKRTKFSNKIKTEFAYYLAGKMVRWTSREVSDLINMDRNWNRKKHFLFVVSFSINKRGRFVILQAPRDVEPKDRNFPKLVRQRVFNEESRKWFVYTTIEDIRQLVRNPNRMVGFMSMYLFSADTLSGAIRKIEIQIFQ